MVSKHTAGPWVLDESTDRLIVLAPDGDDTPWEVAIVDVDCGFGLEPQANARLIAAAPDLLAALERVDLLADVHGAPEVWNNCICEARAAIKKALDAGKV